MNKQIELLNKYHITNYSISDKGQITINGYLSLRSLQACDKDFLKGTTINGGLSLNSLQACDKDFLKGTTINGSLYLNSLQACDKDFLKGTTINGYLDLNSLQACDKDFLKGTTINGYLSLRSLQACDKDFLKGTTINGYLYLRSLQACDKDFLKGATINGSLDLHSLQACDKDFLKGTTINGGLYLNSLQACDKDFLKGTTINGCLYLCSLQACDKDLLENNVKKLKVGYNKKGEYCFFDGILSKVKSVKKTKGYIIYTTPFGYVAQKGKLAAHGDTVKKSIIDLVFKKNVDKLKKTPINKDTVITRQYYRAITGACESGMKQWMMSNGIEKEKIKAMDLLPMLKKTNAFGFNKIKSLVTFSC